MRPRAVALLIGKAAAAVEICRPSATQNAANYRADNGGDAVAGAPTVGVAIT